MLSYQHKYHFGNHADVVKHLTLIALLQHIQKKNKPAFFLDTHAGEGSYSLNDIQLNQDAFDFQSLFNIAGEQATNSVISQYLSLIEQAKQHQEYPGSSYILSQLAREQDVVHLNELGSDIYATLKSRLNKVASIHNRDAFECLNALTPPEPRRGLVLIDPPYEQIEEYSAVCESVVNALGKWPNGIIAIWYPQLSQYRKGSQEAPKANAKHTSASKMINAIVNSIDAPVLDIRFDYSGDTMFGGMYGSGMLLINPPYGIDETLLPVMDICFQYMVDDQVKGHAKSPIVHWFRKPE